MARASRSSFPGVQARCVRRAACSTRSSRAATSFSRRFSRTTNEPWVAYKYHAGLKGLQHDTASRVAWRDIANTGRSIASAARRTTTRCRCKRASRLVVAERGAAGSIAVVPAAAHVLLGARDRDQPRLQLVPEGQRHVVFVRHPAGRARRRIGEPGELRALQRAARHAAAHDGVSLSERGRGAGRLRRGARVHARRSLQAAARLPGDEPSLPHGSRAAARRRPAASTPTFPDLVALKALGINIVSQIDSVGGGGEDAGRAYPGPSVSRPQRSPVPPAARTRRRTAQPAPAVAAADAACDDPLQIRYNSIEGAQAAFGHELPRDAEPGVLRQPARRPHRPALLASGVLGGRAGQPASRSSTTHPKYGKVYHIGSADDLMEMARREDMLINMPHPRTKGSTGYPDSVKDLPFFSDPHYQGVGFRWGMGLDRSEQRLCEYRCLPLLDDMSNWVADKPIAAEVSSCRSRKCVTSSPATTSTRARRSRYVKLDPLPSPDDHSPRHPGADARRLLRDVGRSAHPRLQRDGHRAAADDRRRRRVDVSARLRRGRVGRRQVERTARSSRRPICRRWAASTSRFRSMRRARNGCALRPGTRPATARWCSRSSLRLARRHHAANTSASPLVRRLRIAQHAH